MSSRGVSFVCDRLRTGPSTRKRSTVIALRRAFLTVLLAGGSVLVSPLLGHAYDQMKLPDAVSTAEGAKAVMAAANAAKKEAGPLQATSKDALRVSTEAYMAKMTDKEVLPDAMRGQVRQMLVQTTSADGKAVVARAIIAKSSEIIEGDYAPAAKINAMLALIDEAGSVAPADTLSPLWKYTTTAKTPDHLRCLALHGLDDYVRKQGSAMPAGQRETLAKAMAEIVKSEPTSLSEEKAHWWLVRRAYDMLGSLYRVGTPSAEGARHAMDQFMNPETLPSVRLSAAQYLTTYDLTKVDDATKNKILVGVAQLLDQEVVGWYEQEDDKTKMASAGSGMGGMMGGGMMGGMMGGGEMGGYGEGMGMAGSGSGYGTGGSGPKPIDSQKWDLRLSRRKLNTYCQVAHILLKGNASSKEDKDMSPTGKGLLEGDLPEALQRPSGKLLEALEKVQTDINERSLTTITTMMTRSVRSLQALRDAAEMVPGSQDADGKVVVPSFDQLSPRKKSVKKADTDGALDAPTADAAAPAAPGDAAQPAAPGDAAQPVGDPNAPAAIADPNAPAGAAPAEVSAP